MTYAKLIEVLGTIPFDRLNDTVTVYDPEKDDYCAIEDIGVATEAENDILDEGHTFLIIRSYGI